MRKTQTSRPLAIHPVMLTVIGHEMAERCAAVLLNHARCGDQDAERLLDGVIKSLGRGQHKHDYWLAVALSGARPEALKLVKQAIKDAKKRGGRQRSLKL